MNWARVRCTENLLRGVALWGVIQILAGCAATPILRAPPPHFTPLAGDERVWHENGGLVYAQEVSSHLDQAMARVEVVHGQPFMRPPRVLVCQSMSSFRELVPTPGYTAAVLTGEVLVLSPKLELEEHERLPGILAHELSHLHLGQRLGHYTASLPIWFHEGLASLAADGGGAEFSSDEEACGAWDAGRRVDFARPDSPGKRLRAMDFQLSVYEFYRQSWRFMDFLRRRDPQAFSDFMKAIQAGDQLTEALANAYNSGLERLSREFENEGRQSRQRGDDNSGGQ